MLTWNRELKGNKKVPLWLPTCCWFYSQLCKRAKLIKTKLIKYGFQWMEICAIIQPV